VTLAVVVNSVLSLLKQLSWRACLLEGLDVIGSVRRGMGMFKQYPKDALLVWLSMIAVDLVWPILMAPIGFSLAAVGVVLGGLATVLAAGFTGQVLEGAARWIAAGGLVGLPVLFLVVLGPLAFLAGLREVFQCSTWSLTYGQLRAVESVEPGRLLELVPSSAK
jgi:hypothetical protein